jgi:sulfhydrogenase subunit beta (sulfur reductase)
MLDRVVEKTELLTLIDELSRERTLIGPVPRQDRFFYEVVRSVRELDLAFNYCVYGPRAFLFPPTETLFRFEIRGGSFSATPVLEYRLQAFVGVHPCDLNAIRLLDRVFSREHRDEHYLYRREDTFIIGIDCPKECTPGVFCADMKANSAAEGFDIMCYPLNGDEPRASARADQTTYGVLFGTRAGREWILYHQCGRAPSVGDERAFKQYQQGKDQAFVRRIPYDVDTLPGLLDRSYDSLLWEATARRCYSCGSCNLSCPTCYCFNVYDELDMSLTTGVRKREWDGCQLPNFAVVAGGHNFRAKAASRLRHRIYRKGKWVRQREGISGCVGCARCDRACTAKINSVEIYNQLAEEV